VISLTRTVPLDGNTILYFTLTNFVKEGKLGKSLCTPGVDKSLARPTSPRIFLVVRIFYLMLVLFYIYIVYIYY